MMKAKLNQNWKGRKAKDVNDGWVDGKKTEKEAFREAEAFKRGVRFKASKCTGGEEIEAK